MDPKTKHELRCENYGEIMNEGYCEDFCLANENVVENGKNGLRLLRSSHKSGLHYGSYIPLGNDSRTKVEWEFSGPATCGVKVEDQEGIHYEVYCFQYNFKDSKESRFQNFKDGAEILIEVYAFKTYGEAVSKHLDYETSQMGSLI